MVATGTARHRRRAPGTARCPVPVATKALLDRCSKVPSYAAELLAQTSADPNEGPGACEWKPGQKRKKGKGSE